MNGPFHSNNLHQIIWILGKFPNIIDSFRFIRPDFLFRLYKNLNNHFLPNYRQKLDSENVSLENVIVKEIDSIAVGTIKVKNLSFHKEVIVRSTWDNWKTQQDTFCTFTPVRILYEFSLPNSKLRLILIEFFLVFFLSFHFNFFFRSVEAEALTFCMIHFHSN